MNFWYFSAERTVVTRTLSIRDNTPYEEVIGIKREWQYPLYTHPEFYYDIAVFELGKEINSKLEFTNKSNMKLSFFFIQREESFMIMKNLVILQLVLVKLMVLLDWKH